MEGAWVMGFLEWFTDLVEAFDGRDDPNSHRGWMPCMIFDPRVTIEGRAAAAAAAAAGAAGRRPMVFNDGVVVTPRIERELSPGGLVIDLPREWTVAVPDRVGYEEAA